MIQKLISVDVLREIRKHDSTIYAVLLTNYELDDFADQFGDYDYELQKSEITSRYKDVAEKIKRAYSSALLGFACHIIVCNIKLLYHVCVL